MSEKGFIALARGFLDHPVVGVERTKPFSRSEAWEWMLFEASYKLRRYEASGTVVELQRGQFAHSTRYMATAWRWPETKVRRFLGRLKTGAGTGAMIGADSGAGITVISICNYERYQNTPNESGAASGAPDGAASGAKVAHDRRRKEQSNKVKDIPLAGSEPEGFADWYSIYPRKKARKDAAKAFARFLKAGEITLDDLMARTRLHAKAWTARPKDQGHFCPYPASWLNGGEYLDDAEPTHPTPSGPAAVAALKIKAPERDPRTFTDTDWIERMASVREGGRWLDQYWGPPPGSPGCLVPLELTAEGATA